MSASCAVSDKKMSCTTRNRRFWDRILRIRANPGIDTAGFVALTHSIRRLPCSA
jgi:hypothetical protein